MNFLTALANCAAYFGKWFTSDEQVKARKNSEKAAIDSAVYEGQKDAVNSILKKTLLIPGLIGTLVLSGCATRVVYVPLDRAVYPMVSTNGVAGWFVPNAPFAELIQKANNAK